MDIRQKGAEGERQIYRALNPIVQKVLRDLGYSDADVAAAANCIQRNQNQSAVGGADLINTFDLAIEVKRQENLAVGTWWKQCAAQAKRNNEWPVLLFRQNNKKWRCQTRLWLSLPDNKQVLALGEISWDVFLAWFEQWVRAKILDGYNWRT